MPSAVDASMWHVGPSGSRAPARHVAPAGEPAVEREVDADSSPSPGVLLDQADRTARHARAPSAGGDGVVDVEVRRDRRARKWNASDAGCTLCMGLAAQRTRRTQLSAGARLGTHYRDDDGQEQSRRIRSSICIPHFRRRRGWTQLWSGPGAHLARYIRYSHTWSCSWVPEDLDELVGADQVVERLEDVSGPAPSRSSDVDRELLEPPASCDGADDRPACRARRARRQKSGSAGL